MEQMFHNLNLRTGPPRRALLEEKSRMASQGFCFPCTSKPQFSAGDSVEGTQISVLFNVKGID